MDSRWSQIEGRLNLQSMREFIQHGGDIPELDKHCFTDRSETAYKDLEKYIVGICGEGKADEIMEKIESYTGVCEDIYFALGIKAGAQIIIQLTSNFESDF